MLFCNQHHHIQRLQRSQIANLCGFPLFPDGQLFFFRRVMATPLPGFDAA
ncbi:Uncharacterised protein [Klebsiella pneumoniae]|nr:Uncharacterised protein [Klebsiella pneumoniae]